jgi:hypothetical protein
MRVKYKEWLRVIVLFVNVLAFISFAVSDASARSKERGAVEEAKSGNSLMLSLPNAQQRVHRVSDVQMCMTNWGFVGSKIRDLNESQGGCFNPHPQEELPAPSFEYPAESGLEYLFQGGIWIGAKINDTIYTSVGCDGWQWIYELWPDTGWEGAIKERSIRPNVPCYSPDAISEQDIIAVYTDTSADIPLSPWTEDPFDNRPHHPLDVRISQKSYSWDTEGYDKFIIAEYTIKNIGSYLLSDVYIGFYMDTDILHINENHYYGAQDDITGFIKNYEVSPGDTQEVNIAWAADNDGHGVEGEHVWTAVSPRSVIGMKILHTPNPNLQISYNWWFSSQSGGPRDWGPWKASNQDVWAAMNPYGSGNVFPDNVMGTPGGDVSKYFIMSNGEIDYDQLFACVWPSWYPEEGWLPPSPRCADFANGYDTRFLFSFGSFDFIAPGDSLKFAVAYVIGETLHVDPLNLYHDPGLTHPDSFYAKLYFADLVKNALKAESLYYSLLPLVPGDANGDGEVDIEDVMRLIYYLYLNGDPPLPLRADVNADCRLDLADVVYLINYVFKAGPPPQPGCVKS